MSGTILKPVIFISVVCILASCKAGPEGALAKAAAAGNLSEVKRMLSEGASAGDREGALVWAARSGQPAAIDLLVRNGADPNLRSGVNDWTVLMHAIHKDQPASVIALLNDGADVNARHRNGETALMMAAGYGYTDIVSILLDHGADPAITLPNGENALDFATAGVMDIDRFTWGKCQSGTVRLLRERAPGLPSKNPEKLKSCS